MDFEQETFTPNAPYQNKRSESMATASLILGIVALLTSGCIYLAMVCGSLGIILALLSKGGATTISSQGRVGLILSSAGLILTLIIYIGLFAFVLNYYGGVDGLMQEYMNIYNVDSMEELYQSMGVL